LVQYDQFGGAMWTLPASVDVTAPPADAHTERVVFTGQLKKS
jgi:hypothetical protein